MSNATAAMAQSITWAGSKQTYYTARLMVDKELVDDFFRAYAYFRWADDVVDAPVGGENAGLPHDERVAFVGRQKELIDCLYQNERPTDLAAEEAIVADLISRDREPNSGLQSFIRNMLTVIELDAKRKGRLISQSELSKYTAHVARSVTDGIQYFIGNGNVYPRSEWRYSAAIAAHITHLLRDMVHDIAEGFINIPREYLEAAGIGPDEIESHAFRAWVKERVEQARTQFREGKRYLDELDVLRCKIVGHWYCARFEKVLDTIEADEYVLRAEYNERRDLSTWLKIAWLGFAVTVRHVIRRGHTAISKTVPS